VAGGRAARAANARRRRSRLNITRRSWLESAARAGYAAKGVTYVIAGLLTTAAGLHKGGTTADRRDAIRFIAGAPFGRVLLLLIAIGLIGYAIWRVVSAIGDAEHHGTDAKGVLLRAGSFVRGVFYAGFAYSVMQLLLRRGNGGQGSDAASKHWTSRAMGWNGPWLVTIAGLLLIGYAAYQCYRAASDKVTERLDLARLEHRTRTMFVMLSRFGIAARGLIVGVIGTSLVRASLDRNPGEARGMSGALRQLRALPLGSWILVIVGLGLVSYGVHAFINARYRRIQAAR
jgi:uncharacterized protein DUF1206